MKRSVNVENSHRSMKSPRSSSSMMQHEQVEYNSKMAHMDKEINFYKDKLNKFKTGNTRMSEVENSISQAAGQSTGSFHINQTESIMSMKNDNTEQFNSPSTQKIKVSRKDIRRLTEEEIMKRSSSKNF